MALATYSDLQTSVANHLHRSDLASIIPDLITLAELKIYGDLNSRKQDSITNLATVANQEYVALPADFINARSLVNSTIGNSIDYKSPDAMIKEFVSSSTNDPQFYTIIGDNMYFAPVPDGVYTLRLVYQAKVPALSNTNTTNWLLTNFPGVYLYASLACAAPYLKDDNRIATWQALYEGAINAVNSQDWSNASTMTVRGDTTI